MLKALEAADKTCLHSGDGKADYEGFEGNYYISRKYLRTAQFKVNFMPGFCIYKFLYVWLDLVLDNGDREKYLGWLYWAPNPVFPFIWFRVALPGFHHALEVERY